MPRAGFEPEFRTGEIRVLSTRRPGLRKHCRTMQGTSDVKSSTLLCIHKTIVPLIVNVVKCFHERIYNFINSCLNSVFVTHSKAFIKIFNTLNSNFMNFMSNISFRC